MLSKEENRLTVKTRAKRECTSLLPLQRLSWCQVSKKEPRDPHLLTSLPLMNTFLHWIELTSINNDHIVWLLGLRQNRHGGLCLALSWITCPGRSQALCCEDTRAAWEEAHWEAMRGLANNQHQLVSHSCKPTWQQVCHPSQGFGWLHPGQPVNAVSTETLSQTCQARYDSASF